jgi:hypothetical protein
MSWNSLANNQAVSFNNLQDAVNNGIFSIVTSIPSSNKEITKSEAAAYVNIDTLYSPYATKASNQLIVKSDLSATTVLWSSDYYSAGGNYRLIYSTNYGGSWVNSGSTGNAASLFACIAVSQNGQYLLAGRYATNDLMSQYQGPGSGLKSNNSGSTWSTLTAYVPTTDPIQACAINASGEYQFFAKGTEYYASGVQSRIYRSTNYGSTFSSTYFDGVDYFWGSGSSTSTNGQYITFIGQNANAGNDSVYLFNSNDFGVNWNVPTLTVASGKFYGGSGQQSIGINAMNSLMSGNGQYRICSVYNDYVYYSNDYGVTFNTSTFPFAGVGNWIGLGMSKSGQYQLAIVYTGLLYRSNDYGVTFVLADTINGYATKPRYIVISSSGQYQFVTTYSANMYYSSDYGVTWNISPTSRYFGGLACT